MNAKDEAWGRVLDALEDHQSIDTMGRNKDECFCEGNYECPSCKVQKAIRAYADACVTGVVAALVRALREIKDEQGKVCPDFDSCAHDSCKSSYTSWAIADTALKAAKSPEEEEK